MCRVVMKGCRLNVYNNMFIVHFKKSKQFTNNKKLCCLKPPAPVQLRSSNWDLFFSRKAARYSMGFGGLRERSH